VSHSVESTAVTSGDDDTATKKSDAKSDEEDLT
jgi:hypothetical protein